MAGQKWLRYGKYTIQTSHGMYKRVRVKCSYTCRWFILQWICMHIYANLDVHRCVQCTMCTMSRSPTDNVYRTHDSSTIADLSYNSSKNKELVPKRTDRSMCDMGMWNVEWRMGYRQYHLCCLVTHVSREDWEGECLFLVDASDLAGRGLKLDSDALDGVTVHHLQGNNKAIIHGFIIIQRRGHPGTPPPPAQFAPSSILDSIVAVKSFPPLWFHA